MTTSNPPFKTPHGPGFKNMTGPWEQRIFPHELSDGTNSNWPAAPYRASEEKNYLTKLAQRWAERDGSARNGVNYYLAELPRGYGCFEIDQPGGPQTYKRLFGHPNGRYYDSIARFETHFFWLLDGKQGTCECIPCGNVKPVPGPPKRKVDRIVPVPRPSLRLDRPQPRSHLSHLSEDDHSSRSVSAGGMPDRTRRTARQGQPSFPVDEEGTRNVWKEAVARTAISHDSRYGIEDDIREEESIDWMCERESIPQYLTHIDQQHAFVPRIGELVLWIPNFPDHMYLLREPGTGHYRYYDFAQGKFDGFPTWRAGVVAAVPSAASKNGPVDFPDILDVPEKKTDLNTSGFRIETTPDPNDEKNKSASKQYKYVSLRNIRPLSHWQLVLKGIAQEKLHPSILYAITCMTSVSLVEKWRYNGDWRTGGYISAKAVYLGSELITTGETIRLSPDVGTKSCTDVLVVDSIRLRLKDFRPEHQESETPSICSSHCVTFLGQAFTSDITRAYNYPTMDDINTGSQVVLPTEIPPEHIKSIFRPVGTAQYGSWWRLHSGDKRFEVSYDQVLGRLYEADAIRLWSGQRQQKYKDDSRATMKPDLSFDLESIMEGRRYAARSDERIPLAPTSDPDAIQWLMSDSRAQALTIATCNSLETSAWHDIRTPATMAAWRAHIKISNGEKPTSEMVTATGTSRSRPKYTFDLDPSDPIAVATGTYSGKRRGRPAGSKIVDGKLYTAAMLAETTGLPVLSNSRGADNGIEVEDPVEEGDFDNDGQSDLEITGSQPASAYKHSSQMAGAALTSTDEEDFADDDDEEDNLPQAYNDKQRPKRDFVPLKSRLAAYGGSSGSDDDIDDDIDDEDVVLDDWQLGDVAETTLIPAKLAALPSSKPKISPSKSQIMQSVERGHGSTLANVNVHEPSEDDNDNDSDEEDWSAGALAKWKDIRNARGGSVESEGGDYSPG